MDQVPWKKLKDLKKKKKFFKSSVSKEREDSKVRRP